jgi:putative hemolysin
MEFLVILLLIFINGLLALSEIAVVSSRKTRLQQMAVDGTAGAAKALELANQPGQFLATVQIGITLVGILAGAFGGATLAALFAGYIRQVPLLARYAEPIGLGTVVVLITYLSLVFGELVPKRLALRSPERLAALAAQPLNLFAALATPLVRLLSFSTDAVLRLFGATGQAPPDITEDDVRMMLTQGVKEGVFHPLEEEMAQEVLRLADRRANAVMSPRHEIVWLDIAADDDALLATVLESGHSRFPVAEGRLDRTLGIVLAKDILRQQVGGQGLDLRAILRPAVFVPESIPALRLIERFRMSQTQIAMVIDEYGGVEGLVTVDDLMEALVGDLPDADETEEAEAIQREDGSWLISGMYPVEELAELFDLSWTEDEPARAYQTVGGLAMGILEHVPVAGEIFEWKQLRIEVLDMDGRRVDKVLVSSEDLALP